MSAAILIFGAAVRADGSASTTLRLRTAAALACAAGLDRPLLIPTGAARRGRPAESAVMAGLLRAAGVPGDRVLPDPTSPNTLASVRACAALLRSRNHAGPVLIATSAYHLPRCLALARLSGLRVRACRPPAEPVSLRLLYWSAREVAALPCDVAIVLAARIGRAMTRG